MTEMTPTQAARWRHLVRALTADQLETLQYGSRPEPDEHGLSSAAHLDELMELDALHVEAHARGEADGTDTDAGDDETDNDTCPVCGQTAGTEAPGVNDCNYCGARRATAPAMRRVEIVTTCQATVTERWVYDVPAWATDEDIAGEWGGSDERYVFVSMANTKVEDEQDREVVSIETYTCARCGSVYVGAVCSDETCPNSDEAVTP